jgi:hypothetical protein
MDISVFITNTVAFVIEAATTLLGSLPGVFEDVIGLLYDPVGEAFTPLGGILVATAGFALAWAAVRLIVSYVGKLLNATRGGRR